LSGIPHESNSTPVSGIPLVRGHAISDHGRHTPFREDEQTVTLPRVVHWRVGWRRIQQSVQSVFQVLGLKSDRQIHFLEGMHH
jgi:hypothetical protein